MHVPPPPSTLISRSEVSHVCWHRGVALAAIAQTRLCSLCLVPTLALLEQWVRVIGESYQGQVGCFGDGEHVLRPVTVATFESAYRHMDRIGNRFDLLIVDEAHHFGSGVRDEALEMTIAVARLGLTATPVRRGLAPERLEDLIGGVVFELAISDLAGSFLAPFETMTLRLDLTSEERRDYERWVRLYREPFRSFRRLHPGSSWETFVRLAARSEEGRRAIGAWRRSRRMLAYPQSKRRALRTLLSTTPSAAGHRLRRGQRDSLRDLPANISSCLSPVTSDEKKGRRCSSASAKGHYGRSCLLGPLNEGVDVPDAEIGIIVAGQRGEREHVQRVGRLLRPREGKRALIYEMVIRDTAEVGQAARRREGLVSRSSVAD